METRSSLLLCSKRNTNTILLFLQNNLSENKKLEILEKASYKEGNLKTFT